MTVPTEMEETGINIRLRQIAVAGAVAGNVTITGIRVGDNLKSVRGFLLVEAAPPTITVLDLTSEFSITANDTINNAGGTSSATGILFVDYIDNPNVD